MSARWLSGEQHAFSHQQQDPETLVGVLMLCHLAASCAVWERVPQGCHASALQAADRQRYRAHRNISRIQRKNCRVTHAYSFLKTLR